MIRNYYTKILAKTLTPYAVSLVTSNEYSRDYAEREDKIEIDKAIEKTTKRLAEIVVRKLDEEKLLDGDADEKTFKKIIHESVKELLQNDENQARLERKPDKKS